MTLLLLTQVLLRAYLGFNYTDFYNILVHIANKRLPLCEQSHSDHRQHVFDLTSICNAMREMNGDQNIQLISDIELLTWIQEIESQLNTVTTRDGLT